MRKKEMFQVAVKDMRSYAWTFVRWALMGAVVGFCGGVIGTV